MSGRSYLDMLLDGGAVEWKTLGTLIKTVTAPSKLKSQAYCPTGRLPIVDQGTKFIAGYTNEEVTPVKAGEYVIFGDHSEHIKYVDFAFVQGADGLKILSPISANTKYIYYAFQNFYTKELSYKRHWSTAQETLIPIPCPEDPERSLEIQTEIVRILDAFTELTADLTSELTVELTARKKQYDHYRDQLLRFEEGDVEWTTLGDESFVEVANTARRPVKASLRAPGNNPYYGANNVQDYVDGYTHDGEYVLIAEDGSASLENYSIQYASGKFWANNHVHVVRGKHGLNTKFLYHYLRTVDFTPYLPNKDRAKLTKGEMLKVPVPFPYPENLEKSTRVQAELVRISDKLEDLALSMRETLPRETALRQKQYAYYRDLLLSFPKSEAVEA